MRQLVRYVEKLAPTGDFSKIHEANAIIDSIVKTLLINKGSYVWDPEVGSNLYKYMFSQLDDQTVDEITSEIRSVISQVNNAKLKDIKYEITSDKKGLICHIYVDIFDISKIISIILTQEYMDLLTIQEDYTSNV